MPRMTFTGKTLLRLGAFLLLCGLLASCGSRVPSPQPAPSAPPLSASVPSSVLTPAEADLARLRGELAAADERVTAEHAAAATAKQEAAEAPLRSLLIWAQWAGGALAFAGALAFGFTFTPWGAWIPGGSRTAGAAIATGAGCIILARSLLASLSLFWLPWVALALAALGLLAWVAALLIRAAARYGERVAPAFTPGMLHEARATSAAEQDKEGTRGLLRVLRHGL